VTKAVGDLLGTTGIADEMIRFNGYPFLEQEDHAPNVTISEVMKTDLHALPVSGMTIRDLEAKLASTVVKGFPIITSESVWTLQGYIGRAELRYVLGKFSCS
jgi:chloride channel 3/4/5